MDLTEIQQVLALHSVLLPDSESNSDYQIRKIFRWYSQTFYTPLDQVENLPLADVLEAYFEVHYESLRQKYEEKNDQQLLIELDRLLMTPAERSAAIAAEEAEEMDRAQFAEHVAAQEALKAVSGAQETVQKAIKALGTHTPSNISMSFMSNKEFDDALEQPEFTLFNQPKRNVPRALEVNTQPANPTNPLKPTNLTKAANLTNPINPPVPDTSTDINMQFVDEASFDQMLDNEGGLAPRNKP